MATVLRTQTFRAPLPSNKNPPLSSKPTKPASLLFSLKRNNCTSSISTVRHFRSNPPLFTSLRSAKLITFAFDGDTETKQAKEVQQDSLDSDGAVEVEDGSSEAEVVEAEEPPASALLTLFQSYKEAITDNDESKAADLYSSLKSFEDERIGLERKVASLSEELSSERDRVLRISADFDNFRKRTERERLSLVTNAQGEVVESLLPVLDNFERAKTQIKVETEGEEKINNSYQSIYKQFGEILVALGVVPVETVGKPFDPLLHEAIMREDSTEFEEGIIIQEFRKGFQLGDRLLRPSMVKVSAGPGPAKLEQEAASEGQDTSETPEGSPETNTESESESA